MFNAALSNYTRSAWFVLCEIYRMPKVAMEEDADILVKRRPGALICRLEPDNTQWIMQFSRSTQLMRNVGWFSFCEKFQGYNTQVTRDFIKNYKERVVQFKNLKATVDEESIAEAIGVPSQGER